MAAIMEHDEQDPHVEILFIQDGVSLQVPDDDLKTNSSIPGQLKITKRNGICHVEWGMTKKKKTRNNSNDLQMNNEWAVINPSVNYKSEATGGADSPEVVISTKLVKHSKRYEVPIIIEAQELGFIKVRGKSWELLTLTQKDGSTHPVMRLERGDINNFLAALESHVFLKQSSTDVGSFRVLDLAAKDLEKSFNELQIFGEHTSDFVSRFVQDPYTATLGGFSKVTNFLYDYVVTHGQDSNQNSRSEQEMAEILHTSLSGVEINHNAESGFEVITCLEDLGPRPEITRASPLKLDEWNGYFDDDGRITNEKELKSRIFHGGLDNCVRREAWKFLLSYYDMNLTTKARRELLKAKTEDYFRMKLQWKSFTPEQEKRFSQLHEKKNLVEKDVSRTDRTRSFYVGDNNPNITLLYDILMTYCMYNFDLGYVQGMSDLLSPILVVMEDEVDAFWCFVGFMDRVGQNFEMDQQGMKTQLHQLHSLMQFADPSLSDYLESHESGNLYFCFRWLLIIFKREFVFCDIMRMWEVLWSDLPCKNFHLLCCLAILDNNKAVLLENHFGFTEILKYINDLSQHINLEETLRTAESIYLQIKTCNHTPNAVREILGLPLLASKQNLESSPTSQLASSSDASSIEVICEDREA